MCDREVACLLKVSRRTLGEYRSNGTLPYYVLGGKVLYRRSEIEEVLNRATGAPAGHKAAEKNRGAAVRPSPSFFHRADNAVLPIKHLYA